MEFLKILQFFPKDMTPISLLVLAYLCSIWMVYKILENNTKQWAKSLEGRLKEIQIESYQRLEEVKDDRRRIEALVLNNTEAMTKLNDTVLDLKQLIFSMLSKIDHDP